MEPELWPDQLCRRPLARHPLPGHGAAPGPVNREVPPQAALATTPLIVPPCLSRLVLAGHLPELPTRSALAAAAVSVGPPEREICRTIASAFRAAGMTKAAMP